jgi:hypothetical protein
MYGHFIFGMGVYKCMGTSFLYGHSFINVWAFIFCMGILFLYGHSFLYGHFVFKCLRCCFLRLDLIPFIFVWAFVYKCMGISFLNVCAAKVY